MSGTFADRLRSARDKSGLSQRQLADAVGCSQTLIALMETGERDRPAADTLFRLAATLGVEAEVLFLGARKKNPKKSANPE